MSIQETLDYILKGIVSSPDSIKIETIEDNGLLTLNVTADPEIIGQIIGKEGKIIKSIRTILNLTYPQTQYALNIIG